MQPDETIAGFVRFKLPDVVALSAAAELGGNVPVIGLALCIFVQITSNSSNTSNRPDFIGFLSRPPTPNARNHWFYWLLPVLPVLLPFWCQNWRGWPP
jgi:hypothetical protein